MFGAWRRLQTERNYLLQFLVNKKQQINDDAKQTISKTRPAVDRDKPYIDFQVTSFLFSISTLLIFINLQ